jgi:hypothetical protein
VSSSVANKTDILVTDTLDDRVPNIIAASIAISFIGFVTGPLFATVRVTTAQ